MKLSRAAMAAVLFLWVGAALGGPGDAAKKPGKPKAPQPAAIRLNFKDAPLDVVLQYLSKAAGLSVVTDASLEGRISLISRQALTLSEALSLLDSALKEKGYAAVRLGRVLKIMPLIEAKKANIPVRSGAEPSRITPSDQLITQVIPLRSVDATKLKDSLKTLIPEYATLSADASSNALILTDTEANVRRIVEIVSALDATKSTVNEVKVFNLKYANATSAAKLINEIFDAEKQQSSRSPFTRFRAMFGRRGGRARAGEQTEQYEQQRTIAAADERTNTVVVSGPSGTLEVVAGVIRELDSNPQDDQDVLVYHLKNADAANIEKVLKELFESQTSETAALRTNSGAAGRRAQRGGQSVPGPTGRNAQAAASATTAGSATDLAGKVRVVANTDTNSLLLMAAPKHFPKLRLILAELDRPVPQVLIKVLIAEVTHSEGIDLGVEFSAANLRPSGRGSEVATDFNVTASSEGVLFKMQEQYVSVALRMLGKVGKLDILSRPYVLASNNKEATITVGKEVPFITNSRTTETGQTINTIQYEDIGIILKVTPHINPEGVVIMDVNPEISSLTGETVPISETVNAEVFAKRSATSRVAVRDGQTIVIGGLMEDRKTKTVTKVPLLGDIPYLGALFRRTEMETSKTELLIFLTPHVAKDALALKAVSAREEKSAKIVPEAITPGAFKEHMRLMRGEPPEEKPKDAKEKKDKKVEQ